MPQRRRVRGWKVTGGIRERSGFYYNGETVVYPQLVVTYGQLTSVAFKPITVIRDNGADLSWTPYVNSTLVEAAESKNGCGIPAAVTPPGSGAERCSSTHRWALTPPPPNELTPARSGRSPAGVQSVASRARRSTPSSTLISGFTVVRWMLGGMRRCAIIISTFTRPMAPAAASRCPMLDLTEPIQQPPSSRGAPDITRCSASTSTGSPSGVPVPCAST